MKFVSKLHFQRLASSKAFSIPKGFGCVLFDRDENFSNEHDLGALDPAYS